MEYFFTNIFNMSITASYIIIAVLLVRLLIRKLPKKYSYFLWSVVGFRLAIPISYESVLSIFSIRPFDMTKAQSAGNSTLHYIPEMIDPAANSTDVTVGIPSSNAVINDTLSTVSEDIGVNSVALFIKIFSHIWLAGFVIIMLYGAVSYIVLRIAMSKAVLVRDNVYESDKIQAPFILGFIFPKIYIPFGLDGDTRRYVLAHEKHHIERLDYYIKGFSYLLFALHWFNPLCWISFWLMSKDMEMSCDEKVVADNKGIRKAYSTALLSFAQDSRVHNLIPLCFSECSVKSRIVNVLKFKKPKLWISVIAAVFCVGVVIFCALNPAGEKLKDNANDVVDESISESSDTVIADNDTVDDYNDYYTADNTETTADYTEPTTEELDTCALQLPVTLDTALEIAADEIKQNSALLCEWLGTTEYSYFDNYKPAGAFYPQNLLHNRSFEEAHYVIVNELNSEYVWQLGFTENGMKGAYVVYVYVNAESGVVSAVDIMHND